MVKVNLYGESAEIIKEEKKHVMTPFFKELHDLYDMQGINPSCTYNSYQMGPLHHKLPNTLYIENYLKND